MIGTILLSVWIGGIIGGATVSLGSGLSKGWTVAGGLLLLSIWPAWMFVIFCYAMLGAKMGELKP